MRVGDVLVYDFIGDVQSVSLPPGTYKVECWGGRGSKGNTGAGGKGGYAVGELKINLETELFIYVGKGWLPTDARTSTPGGWNGGAAGRDNTGGAGAGASDIRIGGIALSDRIIVAGGGGGGAGVYGYTGGAGGGITGGNASTGGTGGTQTAGGVASGSLGNGGTGTKYHTAGGGGGYYGGGGGNVIGGGGGGGSGFIDSSLLNASMTNAVRDGNGQVAITVLAFANSGTSQAIFV